MAGDQDYEAKLRAVQEQLGRVAGSMNEPIVTIKPSATPARHKPQQTTRQKIRDFLDR